MEKIVTSKMARRLADEAFAERDLERLSVYDKVDDNVRRIERTVEDVRTSLEHAMEDLSRLAEELYEGDFSDYHSVVEGLRRFHRPLLDDIALIRVAQAGQKVDDLVNEHRDLFKEP
jgi:plasmid stabilization system protein ParE